MSEQKAASSPVVIHRLHDDLGEDDYHEWVTIGWEGRNRVRVDSRGRLSPQMSSPSATLWICNNTNCGAQAFVLDSAIRSLIEAVSDGT